MTYPNHLLPQINFKIIAVSDLPETAYLLRHTIDTNLIDELTGKLRVKYVANPTENLTDYSTNLLGVFQPQDCLLKVAGTHSKNWNVGDAAICPVHPDDFSEENDRGWFCFKITDIIGKEFPYKKANETLIASSYLKHSPINCNYWHFSVRWTDEGGDVEKLSKKARRRILTNAKTLIIEHAKFTDESIEINEDIYIQKEEC